MIGATDSSLNACRRFTRKPEPILLISVEKPTCVREYALDCGAVGSVADRARHPRLTIYRLRISGGMAIAYEKSQKSASARRVTPEAMWRRTLHLIGHSRPESRKFPRSRLLGDRAGLLTGNVHGSRNPLGRIVAMSSKCRGKISLVPTSRLPRSEPSVSRWGFSRVTSRTQSNLRSGTDSVSGLSAFFYACALFRSDLRRAQPVSPCTISEST
jgi:hypothetical protein